MTRGEPTVERIRLEAATLRHMLDGEAAYAAAAGRPGSVVAVSGGATGSPPPTALAAPVEEGGAARAAGPWTPAPDVEIRWPAGWAYVGRSPARGLEGSPVVVAPEIRVEGPVHLKLGGGVVVVGERRFDLRAEPTTPAALSGVREQRMHRVLFDGTVASMRLAPEGDASWIVAGPRATWALSGSAAFRDARGWAEVEGRRVAFEDAEVHATGDLRIGPGATPAVAMRPATYAGSGDLAALEVGGARLVSEPPRPSVGPASVAAVLLAAFALAARYGLALYTRVERGRLLEHERRRAIMDLVHAEPGIHARALQRRVGSAWGAFAFHLRLLRAGGYLRTERHGRYVHVFPGGTHTGDAFGAHPSARKLWEAIPEGGAAVPFPELVSRSGLTRQLADHHLRHLATRGLVDIDWVGRVRHVRRSAPSR